MGWNQDRQLDRMVPPSNDPAGAVVNFSPSAPSIETGVGTAIDLVYQTAEVLQSIEHRAAETTARAHDLARQAAEQLQSAQSRIRVLEATRREAEAALKEAIARADRIGSSG